MITTRDENNFVSEVLGGVCLSSVVSWIAYNLSPEDVFSEKELQSWAVNSGLSPEDLCKESDLRAWAENEDYVKFY